MINRKELGAVLAVVALAACSDTTGPADQSVPVSLSFIVPGSGSVSPALFAQGLELSDGTGNTLVITSAELVIRDIEFARVEVVDCDTAPNPDACEKFEIGPFLVALPLDGSVSTQLLAEVPTGTYKRIDFDIHKVSDDDPLNADFLARHPSLADISIRVRGTFNGQDYTFWSDLNEEQKIELVSPLVVTPGSLAENVTLTEELVPGGRWHALRPGDGDAGSIQRERRHG